MNKPEVIEQWIDEVIHNGKNLTPWENNFIESISEQYEKRGFLTSRQEEILERIYAEKVK